MAYTGGHNIRESPSLTDKRPDSDKPADGQGERRALPASWGPLRITECLCRGTFSAIYRARDAVLDRDIALQLFYEQDATERERLLDEGRRMAGIRHPNIVQALGADEHDDVVGLKMELIEGQTLRTVVEEQGPIPAVEAIVIGRQLCAALAAMHDAGLRHQPIDLQNVVREPDGGIRTMGLCSDIDEISVAPEVRDGGEATPQSDIYALGVLLYRLTTGQFPPPGDGGDLPEQVIQCFDKAIADDPGQRYPTPALFAKALTRATRRPSSPVRRIAGIAIILSLAVLVILQWPSQYRLESSLYLLGPDDFRNELASGAALYVGDCLGLEVTPTVPMFVYVFSEDTAGNARRLFPRTGATLENPLAPDERHALAPMTDGSLCWRVTGENEFRRLHLLASPEPVPDFRMQYLAMPDDGPSDVPALPIIEMARQLDESADIAIGVTYTVIELQVQQRSP